MMWNLISSSSSSTFLLLLLLFNYYYLFTMNYSGASLEACSECPARKTQVLLGNSINSISLFG
jgi:hypothetical protein